jgi:hypothetical protein
MAHMQVAQVSPHKRDSCLVVGVLLLWVAPSEAVRQANRVCIHRAADFIAFFGTR